mgnify:CR=1 FL=1|tara:strand:+ start:2932 stop:3852 length:921 start_codon:yes stop_codon:yes gene_type:complete
MNSNVPKTLHFAGHQTFPLRHNWLTKAADIIKINNQALMNSEYCMKELGVGINMVDSIKHWAESTQLFFREKDQNTFIHSLSKEGKYLFSKDRPYDRYLENIDTIWYIHYLICKNFKKNALWFYMFNIFTSSTFTKDSFINKFDFWINENNLNKPSDHTMNKDFLCIVNMYSKFKNLNSDDFENSLICPFRELRLIDFNNETKEYSLRILKNKEFSTDFFSYTVLDFIQDDDSTISINSLLNDIGSPGQILRLNEIVLVDYLLDFINKFEDVFEFDDTIGNKQLLVKNDFDKEKLKWNSFKKFAKI